MIPSVSSTTGDNKLNIRAPSGAAMAIIAPAADGESNVVKAFADSADAASEYVAGELVEASAYAIDTYGLTAVCCRAATATPGSRSGFVATNTGGTAVGTLASGGTAPTDRYEVQVLFVTGCTVGVRGGTYKVSRDGGHTYGAVQSLGTADEVNVTGAGKLELGAGTVAAGAKFVWFTTGPAFNADSLLDALNAIKLTSQRFTYIQVCGDLDAAAVAVLDGALLAMANKGRYRRAMGHVRGPSSEDAAAYLTALQNELGGSPSRLLTLAAGRCRTSSKVDGRMAHRAPSLAVAPLVTSVPEHIDVAEIQYPLPGVTIRDRRGNPEDHDETVWPGLDDARFLTLRTWEDYEGAYVNNPRLYSPTGSDFLYIQHGRVVDLARQLARLTLQPMLSKGVLVVRDGSGRIQKGDAESIENVVNQELARQIDGQRKATKTTFSLNRNADVLRTGIQPWTVRVIPLAYIKQMPGEVSLSAGEDASPANVLG
jgi:hypothetical protein